ncbi:MAG: hypothetical protein IJM30_03950 [Thermoguttaceae bacterium]|nr:hypothetical protein [Thermoguttaceae bacterium]
MFRSVAITCLFVVLAFCAGCGDKVPVTGRVTYENGTPLTLGQIIFTDDYYMGRSDLDKNGEYSIHTLRRNDGIRKGTYRVYITGAIRLESDDSTNISAEEIFSGKVAEIKPVRLIDMQFMTPDTSGWVCKVKKKSRFDFVVYPPGEVPEDKKTEAAKYMFDPEYRKKVQAERAKENGAPPFPVKKKRTVNPNLL